MPLGESGGPHVRGDLLSCPAGRLDQALVDLAEAHPQLGGNDGVHDSGSGVVSIGSCPRSRMAARTRSWARRWAAVCEVSPVRCASASTAAALARNFVEIIVKTSPGRTVNGE